MQHLAVVVGGIFARGEIRGKAKLLEHDRFAEGT